MEGTSNGNGQSSKSTAKKTTRSGKAGWQQRFLLALCRCPNVSYACDAARIDRKTAYNERHKRPEFSHAWESAIQTGIEGLEREVWRRAHEGTDKPIWMKGADGEPVQVDTLKEYSDVLAIFLLKAHAPAKYRETVRQEVSGPNGSAIEIEASPKLSKERLRELIQLSDARPAVMVPANGNGNGSNGH